MKIYNTLTRKKEEFIPITPGQIKMYCCGQTVYNDITLGNARFYAVFDAIRRYLEYKGYAVRFVQNFTDVDDKIIARANKEGVTSSEIAERYIKRTVEDLENLNIRPATVAPCATEEIPEIIGMVQTLLNKGFAYERNGSVFFETAKVPDYGKLSRKNVDDLIAGARVEVNEDKKSPVDFVLWKPAKPGEPYWDSPWGKGRPGWHIECSAMTRKYLGDSLDIHGGATDLIFPHHENEIAQSEAANGVKFSNFWMHNGLLTVGHKKMSKSAGNFVTLRDVAEKFPYDVIRFYLVSGHYRMPMEYGGHLLEAAKSSLTRIKNCVENLNHIAVNGSVDSLSGSEEAQLTEAKAFAAAFEAAMDDDFNTSDAVSAIFDLVKFINTNITSPSRKLANELTGLLEKLCGLLGVGMVENEVDCLEDEIDALIQNRQEARAAKNFSKADEIRDELLRRGIELKDTPSGVRWAYK